MTKTEMRPCDRLLLKLASTMPKEHLPGLTYLVEWMKAHPGRGMMTAEEMQTAMNENPETASFFTWIMETEPKKTA